VSHAGSTPLAVFFEPAAFAAFREEHTAEVETPATFRTRRWASLTRQTADRRELLRPVPVGPLKFTPEERTVSI